MQFTIILNSLTIEDILESARLKSHFMLQIFFNTTPTKSNNLKVIIQIYKEQIVFTVPTNYQVTQLLLYFQIIILFLGILLKKISYSNRVILITLLYSLVVFKKTTKICLIDCHYQILLLFCIIYTILLQILSGSHDQTALITSTKFIKSNVLCFKWFGEDIQQLISPPQQPNNLPQQFHLQYPRCFPN
eukprot:TRINITY_DN1261_c0_g1_i8.p1 TRINITY_DN1261_c0_g1~~TRINITY_DN1261_c0_g1_i8.p1  ORF type:complete len:189 (+),score=-10.10 TRINITY_DN1261_c0_g1_i8:194-760(+)